MVTDLSSAPLAALQSPPKRTIQRKRGPPAALHIETPTEVQPIILGLHADSAVTSLSSAASEASVDFMRFEAPSKDKPRSLRNAKKLSLSLPSAASSSTSLSIPPPLDTSTSRTTNDASSIRSRSASISSYTTSTATATAALARKHEDSEGGASPVDPYLHGPVEVIPGIWLGNEDNARDTETLSRLGVKAVLNVAKEVNGVDEVAAANGLEYLKLNWSHGEKNLVKEGFPAGFAFVDSIREQGGGVLVQ
jgi:tyrosine-protein phosphatase